MSIKFCLVCNKQFYTKPSWEKIGYGKYCSRMCQYKNRRTGREVSCHVCGKKIYKSNKALNGSKSGNYFCGKSCQTRWRNREFVGEKHANFINGNSIYKTLLNRSGVEKACGLCGTKDSRVLAVHHIDHNHTNNGLMNLAWLCHNCHFLVHHDMVEEKRFLNKRK